MLRFKPKLLIPIVLFAFLVICVLSVVFALNNTAVASENNNFSQANSSTPDLNIYLNGGSLGQINSGSKETKYTNNSVEVDGNRYDNSVEIKGRGNTTGSQPKKPYQIKFDKKVDLFGLGKSKKGVLLANYLDPSNLRNDTAFYIARLLDMHHTGSGQFVNLYIDNQYLGLYGLTHKVEIGSSSVDLSDDGIIVESDFHTPDVGELSFRSNVEQRQFILSDSKKSDFEFSSQFENFKHKYNLAESALYNHDWDSLEQLIDIDSFVNYIIFQELVFDVDGGSGSLYFWQDGPNDVIHCGIPGDYDLALGAVSYDYCSWFRTSTLGYKAGMNGVEKLPQGLRNCPKIMNKVCQRAKDFYTYTNKDKLISYIDSQFELIHSSAHTNNTKGNRDSVTSAIISLKDNIKNRFDYLISYYCNRKSLDDGFYFLASTFGSLQCYLKSYEDGSYEMVNPSTNCCLSVYGGALENDSILCFQTRISSDYQRGYLSIDNNKYILFSKHTGLTVSVNSCGTVGPLKLNDSLHQNFSVQQYDSCCPSPLASCTGDGKIKLTGDKVEGAEKYGISKVLNGGGYYNYNLDYNSDSGIIEYEISDLPNGRINKFIVQAYIDGHGTYYSLPELYVEIVPEGNCKPTNTECVNIDANSATFEGDGCSASTQYAISTSLNNGATGTNYFLSAVPNKERYSYTINGLFSDSKYKIVVTSLVEGSGTPFNQSDCIYIETNGMSPHGVICNVLESGKAKLTGDFVDGAEFYGVSRVLPGGGFYNYDLGISSDTNNFVVEDLANGYTHTFLVQAKVGNIGSEGSNPYKYVSCAVPYGSDYPTKPYDTIATPVGKSINVSFTGIPGATTYAVSTMVNNEGGVNHFFDAESNKSNYQYAVSGLQDDTLYKVVVTAFVMGNWTPFSLEDIKEAKTVSISPTNVECSDAGSGKVKLTGSPVPNAQFYGVSRVLPGGGFYNYKLDIESTTYEFTADDLANGYSHTFLVQANVAGEGSTYSDPSKYKSFTLPSGDNYPTKPYNTTATPVGKSINVSFSGIPGATTYAVSTMVNNEGGVNYFFDAEKNKYNYQYVVSGLQDDTTYKVVVTALVMGSGTPFSLEDIKEAKTVCISPTNVECSDAGSGKVKLTGSPVPNAQFYGVSRVLPGGGFYNYKLDIESTTYEFTADDLANGYSHTFLVQANVAGEGSTYSDPSKYKSFTLRSGDNYPTKPTIVSANTNGNNLNVSFKGCPGSTMYAVSTSIDNGTTGINYFFSSAPNQTEYNYSISGLAVNTKYKVVVTAYVMERGTPFLEQDCRFVNTL